VTRNVRSFGPCRQDSPAHILDSTFISNQFRAAQVP
jgi:hypothetical protein